MMLPRVKKKKINLTCGKGETELQNLTNLRLPSFAESHQMQHKNTSSLRFFSFGLM